MVNQWSFTARPHVVAWNGGRTPDELTTSAYAPSQSQIGASCERFVLQDKRINCALITP